LAGAVLGAAGVAWPLSWPNAGMAMARQIAAANGRRDGLVRVVLVGVQRCIDSPPSKMTTIK